MSRLDFPFSSTSFRPRSAENPRTPSVVLQLSPAVNPSALKSHAATIRDVDLPRRTSVDERYARPAQSTSSGWNGLWAVTSAARVRSSITSIRPLRAWLDAKFTRFSGHRPRPGFVRDSHGNAALVLWSTGGTIRRQRVSGWEPSSASLTLVLREAGGNPAGLLRQSQRSAQIPDHSRRAAFTTPSTPTQSRQPQETLALPALMLTRRDGCNDRCLTSGFWANLGSSKFNLTMLAASVTAVQAQ